MPHPGGHCEDPGFSSEQDGSHWRILSKGLMKLPYVLTGLLGLLICKHPERDTGGCAEINKEPATIIEMIVAGGGAGGGGGMWSDPKCILKVESTGFAAGLDRRRRVQDDAHDY